MPPGPGWRGNVSAANFRNRVWRGNAKGNSRLMSGGPQVKQRHSVKRQVETAHPAAGGQVQVFRRASRPPRGLSRVSACSQEQRASFEQEWPRVRVLVTAHEQGGAAAMRRHAGDEPGPRAVDSAEAEARPRTTRLDLPAAGPPRQWSACLGSVNEARQGAGWRFRVGGIAAENPRRLVNQSSRWSATLSLSA